MESSITNPGNAEPQSGNAEPQLGTKNAEEVEARRPQAHRAWYDLTAWVVMPNHVRVPIRVHEGAALGRIVQSWKSYTDGRIAELGLGVPRK